MLLLTQQDSSLSQDVTADVLMPITWTDNKDKAWDFHCNPGKYYRFCKLFIISYCLLSAGWSRAMFAVEKLRTWCISTKKSYILGNYCTILWDPNILLIIVCFQQAVPSGGGVCAGQQFDLCCLLYFCGSTRAQESSIIPRIGELFTWLHPRFRVEFKNY